MLDIRQEEFLVLLLMLQAKLDQRGQRRIIVTAQKIAHCRVDVIPVIANFVQ
jgi:hypothetical protein